jgi:hypothetical protein
LSQSRAFTRRVEYDLRVAGADRCLVLLVVCGCGTLSDGARWGERATPVPGWDRVLWAAERNAVDPATWIPAAGAVVFGVGEWDERVSDWARDHTPVFGSTESADDESDRIKGYLGWGYLGTALLTPSGDEPVGWVMSKTKGIIVETAGEKATSGVVSIIKNTVERQRPDKDNHRSFPSSHAGSAMASATMIARNLDSIEMPSAARTGLKAGGYAAAGMVSWARVEAGKHYPADVLGGMAIGRFFSGFLHDAFLGLPRDDGPKIEIAPHREGVAMSLVFEF